MSDVICSSCGFPSQQGVESCPLCHTPLQMPKIAQAGKQEERGKTTFDASKTSISVSSSQKVAGAVIVTSGAQVSAFVLLEGRTIIGRDPDCTISLEDGKISSRHGTIFIDGKRDRFVDDSTNGSVVNGEIVFCDAISIENGAQISIGDSTLLILLAP